MLCSSTCHWAEKEVSSPSLEISAWTLKKGVLTKDRISRSLRTTMPRTQVMTRPTAMTVWSVPRARLMALL